MTFRDNRNEIDAITSAGPTSWPQHVRARPQSALAQARQAAADGRVAIAGGVATLNQYLSLGAIDELRLHVVPITLGAGERVFDGVGGLTFGIDRIRPTGQVVHITLRLPAR